MRALSGAFVGGSEQTASSHPRTWEEVSYRGPVPHAFLVPEHHWPHLQNPELSREQRIRLNQLATCFMCEMFIFFEEYIIEYLQRYRLRPDAGISEKAVQRFAEEERRHTEAFENLLSLLRPDLYPEKKLRFLSPSWTDRLMIRLTPAPAFFLAAALFEEMTLFVPVVMDEKPEESFAPVLHVMHLHARDERGHTALDYSALRRLSSRGSRWFFALKAFQALPVLAYVDRVLARAWKKAAYEFSETENLTRKQRAAISRRRPSRSDELGMRSFIEDERRRKVPGSRAVCAALQAFAF